MNIPIECTHRMYPSNVPSNVPIECIRHPRVRPDYRAICEAGSERVLVFEHARWFTHIRPAIYRGRRWIMQTLAQSLYPKEREREREEVTMQQYVRRLGV